MRLYSITIPIVIVVLILATVVGVVAYNKDAKDTSLQITSPIVKTKQAVSDKFSSKVEKELPKTDLVNSDITNILLLGVDRRHRDEPYRTDIMILLSIDKKNNRVLLTSVPRDLWYGSGRLNAVYQSGGHDALSDAFADITGMRPTRFILTDFADFTWLVDAIGGLPVDVQTTFTDSQYPVDATLEYQTITFTKGKEILTGERALIFARSRKGDFDNGDWGRMRRQHLMLKSLVTAAFQPKSFVCSYTKKPFESTGNSCATYVTKETLEQALKTVTTAKMDTNLNIFDLTYLWDFYKDKDKYVIESLIMDYTYLYTPPMEEYGGAWVLAPIGDSYSNFHEVVKQALAGTLPKGEPQDIENSEIKDTSVGTPVGVKTKSTEKEVVTSPQIDNN